MVFLHLHQKGSLAGMASTVGKPLNLPSAGVKLPITNGTLPAQIWWCQIWVPAGSLATRGELCAILPWAQNPQRVYFFEQCVNDGDLWCVLLKLVCIIVVIAIHYISTSYIYMYLHIYNLSNRSTIYIYIREYNIHYISLYNIYNNIYVKTTYVSCSVGFSKTDFSPWSLLCAAALERRGEAINDVFGPSKLEKSPMQKAAFHGEWR